MDEIKIPIPARLKNVAKNGHVAGTEDIYDDELQKTQKEINAEQEGSIAAEVERATGVEEFLQSEISGLNSQNYVSVDSYSELPELGSVDTVYRVGSWDGTQVDPTKYAEYAWNNTGIDQGEYKLLSVKTQVGEVFDISDYRSGATYADLAAALDGGDNVPAGIRRGGMSVKYIQSSDNKYVQYRLMADDWSTTVADWQGDNGTFIEDYENFGDFSQEYTQSYSYRTALKCEFTGKITSVYLKLASASDVTISVCKAVNNADVLRSVTFSLNAGVNIVQLENPLEIASGNMVMCDGATPCYAQVLQLDDIFYNVNLQDGYFVKRTDHIRITFGFTVISSVNVFDLKDNIKAEETRAKAEEASIRTNLQNVEDGNFNVKENIGDYRSMTTYNISQQASLLCPISGTITNAVIHTGEASTATLKVYKGIKDTTLLATYSLSLEAGVNQLSELNIPISQGNMVYVTGTKLTYNVYSSEDSVFYLYNDAGFYKRTDHVSFQVGYTISKDVSLYDVIDNVETLQKGNFNAKTTIGDATTASTFNTAQRTGLICSDTGIVNNATIHTGEASTATIEVYKGINNLTMLSTKDVSLDAGVNQLSNLNISVAEGNVILIYGTKLTYRIDEDTDSIFYSKGPNSFTRRTDHVRFEIVYEIDTNVDVFDTNNDVQEIKEVIKPLTEVYISITPTNDNYNLIRDAIASITDASENKHYIIVVPEGEYIECDIQGKKYVTIKGENRDRVIIKNDGTSTKVTPSDYFWSSYANTPLNEIPRNEKHIVAPKDDIVFENCTLVANECKYVVHGEFQTWYKVQFKNCKLEATNCQDTIGLGLRHIQNIEFIDCHLVAGNGVSGIMYYHNWTWRQTTDQNMPLYSGGCKAIYENCKLSFSNDNWLLLDELASRNDDMVLFKNCELDYPQSTNPNVRFMVNNNGTESTAIDLNGDHYTDLEEVPYCMRLIAVKSGFNDMSIVKSNRPLAENYVQIIN